jgi:glycosyltransferase involved in cell wall biosynthesis
LSEFGTDPVDLASIHYHLDPGYFDRQGVELLSGLLDFASKLPAGLGKVRQALKAMEYLLNLLTVWLRCLIRRPGVVHVQFLPLLVTRFRFEIWFLKGMRRLNVPLVYTVHNVLPHDTGNRYRAIFQEVYGLMDLLICHDEPAKLRLQTEFEIHPGRITVIPHGPLFAGHGSNDAGSARESLKLPPEHVIVLFQGIIRGYKGVDVLLDAWGKLKDAKSMATLVVAGSGSPEIEQDIRDRVAQLGPSASVRLELRFISAEELENCYTAADILVYPFRGITTSGSLMTGIGRGKPILASRLPAFEELLTDGENSILVAPGDSDELADALERLISDKALRDQLAGGISQSGPGWRSIAEATAGVYKKAVGDSQEREGSAGSPQSGASRKPPVSDSIRERA